MLDYAIEQTLRGRTRIRDERSDPHESRFKEFRRKFEIRFDTSPIVPKMTLRGLHRLPTTRYMLAITALLGNGTHSSHALITLYKAQDVKDSMFWSCNSLQGRSVTKGLTLCLPTNIITILLFTNVPDSNCTLFSRRKEPRLLLPK